MKPHTKLTQREHVEHETEQHLAQGARLHEFASVEALLRHDAAQTPVPPELTRRVQEAATAAPAPKRGPWQRLFGR